MGPVLRRARHQVLERRLQAGSAMPKLFLFNQIHSDARQNNSCSTKFIPIQGKIIPTQSSIPIQGTRLNMNHFNKTRAWFCKVPTEPLASKFAGLAKPRPRCWFSKAPSEPLASIFFQPDFSGAEHAWLIESLNRNPGDQALERRLQALIAPLPSEQGTPSNVFDDFRLNARTKDPISSE